jgi:hypothetical protein
MLRRLAVVLTLIALAALAVEASAAPAAEQPDPGARMLVPADPAWNLWPTNERGQTYGAPQETAAGYHEPDLMRVQATNGETGYALSSELAGPQPITPEEALEWQAQRGGEPRTIPVYQSDGLTQIGVFDVGSR